MEEEFRKMLEYFYDRATVLTQKPVYKQVLSDYLDTAEIEPVHIIATKQTPISMPSIPSVPQTKVAPIKKREYLYKSGNFPSVFLFGFLLSMLKSESSAFIQNLHGNILKTILEEQNQSAYNEETQYRMLLIDKIFEFLVRIKEKNYASKELNLLFKKFYLGTFERRGLTRNERQKFPSEAQILLPYILAQQNKRFTESQVCIVNSDAYQNNQLNFCIVLENAAKNEEEIIGEGRNQIKIVKQRNNYLIEKNEEQEQSEEQNRLDEEWEQILESSVDIRKQCSRNGLVLLGQLNLTIQRSPTSSRRAPKSANFQSLHLKKQRKPFLD